MSILRHVFIGMMYLEAIIISLFLAGCAVGVCLWGFTKWNDRARQHIKEGAK